MKASMMRLSFCRRFRKQLGVCSLLLLMSVSLWAQARTFHITADKDSRYKMDGTANPTLVLKAGETVHLHITANRGKTFNRDGSVHGFALVRAKDRTPVKGWAMLLKPGEQDFDVVTPNEPGTYEVVCTVICSAQHEQMRMKVVVTP
jgi:heme/copper-type cytochrome/quinol oxidase subunit 2